MTNSLLYTYSEQLKQMASQPNIFQLLLMPEINKFHYKNRKAMKALNDKLHQLNLEYYEQENGDFKLGVTDGKPSFIFKEGKSAEQYKLNFDLIMAMPCQIVLW